jgi:3-dehydroquinate dehydratase
MVFSIMTARRIDDMGKKKDKHIKKLEKLNEVMQNMVDGEFTGHVKINFSQGGIGRIEKFEEILREEDR